MISFSTIALATVKTTASEGGGGSLLTPDTGLIVWSGITFLLLLLVLGKFAWKPILKALKDREESIREALDSADKARLDARALIEENQKNMAVAQEESQKIIEQSRQFAETLKQQMIEEGKVEARKVIENAHAEIERKKLEVLDEIKNQVASLSLDIASKLLKKNLDAQSQKALIDASLEEIRKN